MNLVYQQFKYSEGARIASADVNDDLTFDLSHVVPGAMITVQQLVKRLAEATGQSREEVAAEVREYVNS